MSEVQVASTSTPIEVKAPETAVEPKVEGAGSEEVKIEDIKSRRFAELSKKEQKVLQKHLKLTSELKQREENLSRRESEIKLAAKRELQELIKANPNKAFEELGTSYNSVTDRILSDGKVTPESVKESVNEEIQALRKELENTKLSIQQQQQLVKEQENQKILQQFSANIVETVKNSAEKYPAVHTFEGAPVVYEMIQKRWHDTKGQHLMTIDEAASLLEKDLGGLVEKLLQTPKYASRVNPQTKKEDAAKTSLSKPKTITNELTSSAPSMLPPKTENDRIKRALEKLQGA